MQPRTYLFGHVCIDHNRINGHAYTKWGSSLLYIDDYLRRSLGVRGQICAPYGPDLQQHIAPETTFVSPPDQPRTMVYENIVTGHSRVQYCHDAPPITAVPSTVAPDIAIIAPLTPNYVTDFIAALPATCLKVLLPQGYFRQIAADGLVSKRDAPELAAIVGDCDLVILSDEDHDDAWGLATVWSRTNPELRVIVTQNSHGATVFQAGHTQRVTTEPIEETDLVDAVGCGDVFSAQLTRKFYENGDIIAAVVSGHQAARRKLLGQS